MDTLILFVTSRCNSRCLTCFYWEELNQKGDLTLSELRRLSSTMPDFNEVWLSGGEPTLREDLPQIISTFYEANGIRSINFPTNGLLTEKLVEQLRGIGTACPDLRINLNVALDGFEATHDRLRDVPGNFQKALRTLGALQELRTRLPELRLHINSVICRDNIDEMLPLGQWIRDQFDLDGHYFQVIRGEPLDPALLAVHKDSVKALYRDLQPIYRHYAERIEKRKNGIRAPIARVSYVGTLNLYHQIQSANLDRHDPWPVPCTAGQNIAVVDANGNLRACELRDTLGNLRDFDCDWNRFWQSKTRTAEIDAIMRDGCWCTHVCFIHASVKASTKALVVDIPRAYFARV